jgi:RHS repeat-associated protein
LTINTYDTLDHLTQSTQGAQARTSSFDPLGRLLSARIIEVNAVTDLTYGYNNDGLRTSVTDPRGTVSFDFDELHRPTRKRYNGTVTASYGYDGPQSVNGVGRLVAENDGDFGSGADHSDYTYDEMGRVRSANRTVSSTAYPVAYTYDLVGDLASMGYPSGRLVQYDLTGGQLNKLTDTTNPQAPFDYVSTTTYAAPGTLQQMNFGNNVVTALSWNNRGQLASISTQKTGGSAYLSLGYGYFAAGQVQQITNNLNSNKSEKYTYDDLRRLLTAQLGPDAAMVRKYQYDYDRYGNRWGQNVVAGSGYNSQLAFDTASNRVNFGGFSFDASGNLATNASGATFTFNQESFITSAGAVSYKIDAQGRLVRKTNGAAVTNYFYNGSDLLAEKTGSQWPDYIFIGDQRIAQQTGNSAATVIYLHVDHLGSTRVSTDGSGNSNGICDYEPFGETQVGSTCSVPTNFRYAGMQWDSESNLFHTWFRQYDPTQGRWMGVDPLPGSEDVSQSMDRYAYVLDDPVNGIDPYGLAADDFEVLFGTPGDPALVTGGYQWIRGQLVKCQVSGIPMLCEDFAAAGYLQRYINKLYGDYDFDAIGDRHFIRNLALVNKLQDLMAALGRNPCGKNVGIFFGPRCDKAPPSPPDPIVHEFIRRVQKCSKMADRAALAQAYGTLRQGAIGKAFTAIATGAGTATWTARTATRTVAAETGMAAAALSATVASGVDASNIQSVKRQALVLMNASFAACMARGEAPF